MVRTKPHIACCAAIPLREKHSCHHPTTVLSGSRSERLLAVPYSELGPQVDVFRSHGKHQIECDDRTPEDSKRSLPPVLPTMAGSTEQVCVRARVLLWKWSGKRCHMTYHYSAIPHFRELFDCMRKIKKEEEIENFKCHHTIKYFSIKCKEINFQVNIIYKLKLYIKISSTGKIQNNFQRYI
jgi:hypothetical protein